jgi:hypothetical protein
MIDIIPEMRCIEFLRYFFLNSEFLNWNFDFSIFQQQNLRKFSNRNLWNRKRNWNSASNGGPRNWNRKTEFPTKLQHGRLLTFIEGESTQQKHNSKVSSISFSDTKTGRSLLQHSTSLSHSAITN